MAMYDVVHFNGRRDRRIYRTDNWEDAKALMKSFARKHGLYAEKHKERWADNVVAVYRRDNEYGAIAEAVGIFAHETGN